MLGVVVVGHRPGACVEWWSFAGDEPSHFGRQRDRIHPWIAFVDHVVVRFPRACPSSLSADHFLQTSTPSGPVRRLPPPVPGVRPGHTGRSGPVGVATWHKSGTSSGSTCTRGTNPPDVGLIAADLGHRVHMALNEQDFSVTASELFDVLVDAPSFPRWLAGVGGVRCVSDDWPKRESHFEHAGTWPLPAGEVAVVDIDPPRMLEVSVRCRRVRLGRVRFEIEELASGCRLTMCQAPGGSSRPLSLLARPLLRVRDRRSLRRLRSLLEGSSYADRAHSPQDAYRAPPSHLTGRRQARENRSNESPA